MGLRSLLTTGLLLALASTALADVAVDLPKVTRLRVGIVPGMAVNVDTARVDALAQDLADALAAELEVEVVGGLEVRRKLPDEGIPLDCVTNRACILDVAKRLDVSQLLFVVMVNTGATGAIQVDTTWVDAVGGQSATRRPIDVAVIDQARARFTASATLLLPGAPVRKKPIDKPRGEGGWMSDAVPRHVTKPAMLAAGVAVVGLGIGIAFGAQARSSYSDCERIAGSCDQGAKDKIRTKNMIADISFMAAAASAITFAILYGTSGKESKVVVGPTVESRGAGVTLSGRF